jgi:hypothetical protein
MRSQTFEEPTMQPLTFGSILITLWVAHKFADHIIQTDSMAARKMGAKLGDWALAFIHAASHVTLSIPMLAVLAALQDTPINWAGTAAGMTLIGFSHWFIDRRWPVQWLMRHTGSAEFAKGEGPVYGPYHVDQTLHISVLWIAALPITFGVRAVIPFL